MTLTFTKPPQPRINYAHPANKNIQFSYIASPGFSAFDLVKRQFGTKGSAPTQALGDKIIGPAIKFRASQADVYTFASRGTKSSPATMAFIGILNSNTTGQTIFQNSSGASGITFDNQNGGALLFVARNIAVLNPSLAFTTGVPYLFIGSIAANFTVNFLSFRMDTGAIATATSTNGSGPTAGNGTYSLGNLDLLSGSAGADLAALLYSNTFMTLDAMRAWAKDPWGPWRSEQPSPAMLMASSGNNTISGTKIFDAFTQTGTATNVSLGSEHWSTTYNPSNVTLSNSNLTATATAHNVVDTIISVQSHSSGKYYFEHSTPTGSDCYSGLAAATQSSGSAISATGVAIHYDGAGNAGTWVGNANTASGLTVNAGKVLGFAVDFTNSRIYVRDTAVPGSWFGNGAGADPVAGTGGYDWSNHNTVAMFQAFTSFQNGINEATIMNAGATSFIAAAPSGYDAWADASTYAFSVTDTLAAASTQSGQIIYNAAMAESATAATAQSETFITNPTVSESMTAATIQNEALTGHPTVTENITITDTASEAFTAEATVAETMTAADTASGGLSFDASVSESASAVDTVAIPSFNLTISESASAAATQDGHAVESLSVVESMTVTEQFGRVINLIVNDTLNARDHTNRSLVFNLSRDDHMMILDHDLPYNYGIVTDDMDLRATFMIDVDGTRDVRVRENESITDTIGFSGLVFDRAVSDVLTIRTKVSANDGNIFNVAVKDFLNPVTIHRSNLKTNTPNNEALTIIDLASAYVTTVDDTPGIWNLSILESANVVDSSVNPLTFTEPGIYFWGYGYYYGKVKDNLLAVWCAGLDCGDWPVQVQGYVFVPWQSDPDGLFTPSYLMNLSNNPPLPVGTLTGFGATAVNIDLTDNTGGLTRIVVDLAIGLPYRSRVQVLRPNAVDQNHSPFGPSLAETRRLHQYGVQLVNAQHLSVGTTGENLRPMIFLKPNGDKYLESELRTGVHWDFVDDDYDYEGMLMMQMFRPYPATIASLISFFKTFDRD